MNREYVFMNSYSNWCTMIALDESDQPARTIRKGHTVNALLFTSRWWYKPGAGRTLVSKYKQMPFRLPTK